MSSSTHELNVSLRDAVGTSAVRRLRRTGKLPAVVYGRGEDVINLSVDAHTFGVMLARQEVGGLLNLKLEGNSTDIPVIVKELQIDPRRNEVRTLDFLRVSLTEKVEALVLVMLEGEPVGVRVDGGLLSQSLHEVLVSAFPQDLPEQVTVDITDLELNGSIHVKDIPFPEGVESAAEADEIVASVSPPRAEAEEPEEAVEGAEGEAAPAEGAEETAAAKKS